jgi:hypothetical protein
MQARLVKAGWKIGTSSGDDDWPSRNIKIEKCEDTKKAIFDALSG